MRTKIFLLFSFFLFLVLSCSNPFANQRLSMTADPGVTEAWLSLHVDGVRSGAEYMVQRDGTTIFKGRLQSPDTVVYDSLLTPATTYTYRFYARENGEDSPALQSSLTTLDTTSHNFSWQSYEFGGQKGSSSFYDVAIIDENDIWAVGEIHTEDTDRWNADSTVWLQPYNVAHWDGQKWELKRVVFHTFCDQGDLLPYPARSVFYIGNTLLISSGSEITFLKNGIQVENQCTPVSINKIWGTSSSDLYVVGNGGLIAHYNGISWTKIESGTDLPLRDIWGSFNYQTNTYDIYTIASDEFNSVVLKLTGKKVIKYPVPANALELSGIWFQNNRSFYIVGDGIFTKKRLSDKNWFFYKHGLVTSNASAAVRGTDSNDIFVSGGFFELVHFNGISWHKYSVPFSDDFGVYGNIDIRNHRVVLVGYHHQKAIIVSGER